MDDATVTIENINYHLEHGEDVEEAILNGALQIAVPAFVSTLAICIVFVPMFLLAGIARFLFVPLAEAVVFAMLASYVLSRTLVPTLAKLLAANRMIRTAQTRARLLGRFSSGSSGALNGSARATSRLLQRAVSSGTRFAAIFGGHGDHRAARLSVRASSAGPRPGLLSGGRRRPDQAARARPHRNAHRGDGRPVRPGRGRDPRNHSRREISSIVDNIGLPYSGINLAYSTVGARGYRAMPTSW